MADISIGITLPLLDSDAGDVRAQARRGSGRRPLPRRGPAPLAERFAAFADAGAERLVVGVDADDWARRTELVAEAVARLV